MNLTGVFLSGLAATVLVSLAVIAYLRQSLAELLVELCGNERRAGFWTAFSAVTIGAVPVIFALACRPCVGSGSSAVLEIASQLEWRLIGMVLSVLFLGWTVGRFILKSTRKA